MHGDQPLGDPQRLRRVTHDDHVLLLISHDIAGFHDRLDGIHHLLGIGVVEEKDLAHKCLVFPHLGRCIRVNQDGVGVQYLVFQLVGQEQDFHRRFDRRIAEKYRCPEVAAHVAVENKIQPGSSREYFKDLADRRVLELDRDRLLETCRQLGIRNRLGQFHVDLVRQRNRTPVGRIFTQYFAQQIQRLFRLARGEKPSRLRIGACMPLGLLQLRQTCQGPRVAGLHQEHPPVPSLGGHRIPRPGDPRRAFHPAVHGPFACHQIRASKTRVGGLQTKRLLKALHAFVEISVFDQGLAFPIDLLGGTTSQGKHGYNGEQEVSQQDSRYLQER